MRMKTERYKSINLRVYEEDLFKDAGANEIIMQDMPNKDVWEASKSEKKSIIKNSEFVKIKNLPLLSMDQEKHVFRQYNYLKYLLNQELQLQEKDESKLDNLVNQIIDLRNFILDCNFKLVFSFVKNKNHNQRHTQDIYSDCCLVMLRSVDYFDYRLNNKFSTYVVNSFHKVISSTVKNLTEQDQDYKTGTPDGMLESKEDFNSSFDEGNNAECIKSVAEKALNYLKESDPRAYEVIMGSFSLETGTKKTLEEIGKNLSSSDKKKNGVSKERVRQIRKSALLQMKNYLEEIGIHGDLVLN